MEKNEDVKKAIIMVREMSADEENGKISRTKRKSNKR